MSYGIVGYGTYLPAHRLAFADIAAALGSGPVKGSRVVASFDEDSTTMGVEAARSVVAGREVDSLWFATTSPAYAEKTNAAAVRAALGLSPDGFAVDLAGSPRSGEGAMRAAAAAGGLAVLGDVRVGLPGSADERESADGAAAFLFGPAAEAVAVAVGHASVTGEFLDRWRAPGEATARQWEERFGVEQYEPLIANVVARALAAAGIEKADVVLVSSPHARAATGARARYAGKDAVNLGIGHAGAADLGLRLADALDRATPGQTILTISAVDGADATVWKATNAIAKGRAPQPVASQLAAGRPVGYSTYLTWRGLLNRELPRRPEPDRPAGPPSARSMGWKFAFVGSSCDKCGFIHLPPARVCASCRTADQMSPAPLAAALGTVAAFTADRLAYSLSPPMISVVVDFDGGGRALVELADAGPEEISVGSRVTMTFRRLYTSGGVHNYFWKARLVPAALAGENAHGE